MDACGGANDVDDGVDCAYFVEVDLFDVDVVDFGFGGSEEFEGFDGRLLDLGGEVSGLDEPADDGEGVAVGVAVLVVVVFFVGVGLAGFVEVLGLGVVMVGLVFGGALVFECVGKLIVWVGCGWGGRCAGLRLACRSRGRGLWCRRCRCGRPFRS